MNVTIFSLSPAQLKAKALRSALKPIDRAEAMQELKEMMLATDEWLANEFGLTLITIKDILKLNDLPDFIKDEARGTMRFPRHVLSKLAKLDGQKQKDWFEMVKGWHQLTTPGCERSPRFSRCKWRNMLDDGVVVAKAMAKDEWTVVDDIMAPLIQGFHKSLKLLRLHKEFDREVKWHIIWEAECYRRMRLPLAKEIDFKKAELENPHLVMRTAKALRTVNFIFETMLKDGRVYSDSYGEKVKLFSDYALEAMNRHL